MNEFDFIATHLAPLAGQEALDLKDDAACWQPPSGYDVIISTDMLAAGVHFPEAAPAAMVAARALACALSDLAAKGAQPAGCLLTLCISKAWDEDFLVQFAKSFGQGLTQYNVALWGGDTIAAATASVSLTVHGLVPHGTMIPRAGAHIGDDVYVSGTIGDGFLGLRDIQQGIDNSPASKAYTAPQPQLALGQKLRGIASAAIDISDGLMADLQHICTPSAVGMAIDTSAIPLSAAGAQYAKTQSGLGDLLSGGDDYQLAFTAPQSARALIGDNTHIIGKVVSGQKPTLHPAISLPKQGYTHI